jgi:hypothetical protein
VSARVLFPSVARFAAQRSFIRAANFARASGLSRRFFLFFCTRTVGCDDLAFVDRSAFRFLVRPLDEVVVFDRSFVSFFVSFAILATRRRIFLFRFFSFIIGFGRP